MAKRSGGWRLLIVDDDPHRRRELESNAEKIPEVEAVTGAGGVGEATALLEQAPLDVVIIDLDCATPQRLAEFGTQARAKGASVILVTAGQDPSVLAEVMEWASGFLSRGSDATAIGYAMQVVRTGAFYMESDQARGMVEELETMREVADRGPGGESLTPREKEVLSLLSEGLSARQMARRLELSERTINTHVANVYRKLAVSNRVQAVRQAIRLGLVSEPK
jgi:DNA-binding NarL/FixJ family response regulator